jgi:hypothetical protein
MNYKNLYKNLIFTRKNRQKIIGEYYEKHHIIPKCIGGTDNINNIVYLTGREHYVAHWLLYRIRPHSTGISLAFWKMSIPNTRCVKRKYNVSSKAYQEAKMAMAEANRKLNLGRKVKSEHLIKWTKNKNNSKNVINVITGEVYSNSKQLWREKYSDQITYSAFNYYLRNKIKRKSINRKLNNLDIYNWKYIIDENKKT